MLILVLYVSSALAISFVCSVLEATLLSARTAELLDRKGRNDRGATLLLQLKQERVDEAIGAILTLNTIAHTVGSALSGAQAAFVFGEVWVGVFSAVLTLLVLVITEIIPKTLGTIYASRLVGPVAYVTNFLTRLLHPALVVIGALTKRLLPTARKPRVSPRHVAALAASAARDGSLSRSASKAVANVLGMADIRLKEVMIPRTGVTMLPESTTIAEFLSREDARVFARIPLFRSEIDDASAYVLQRDVLAAAISDVSTGRPLGSYSRPAVLLPETVTLESALERLVEGREKLALVFDEFGSIAGLATLEDLVEAALGVEIVDETDLVPDLRSAARKRFSARLRKGTRDKNEVG